MKSSIRVLPDGREICKGYQWCKRVVQLRARSEGYCEGGLMLPGHKAHYIGDEGDPQHITKRSKARDDRLTNLLWVCRSSHNAMDQARPALRKQWEHAAKERVASLA
jgi:hypothetical protein